MSTSQQLRSVATGQVADTKTAVASFSKFMDTFKAQLEKALPKHMNADRMARLAVTSFSTTPALQECTPHSIAGSIMTAATLGLEPGVNGQGYLIPYKKTCTFVPGWKGLVDLVSRSGRATVWTGAVFAGDEFDYGLGDRPFVRHKPGGEDDPKKITHVYSVGRVNGSDYPVIEVWPIEKVWRHRDKLNKQGGGHYSFKYPEMYARKIPLLQVIKYLPSSIELANAVAISDAAERGAGVTIESNFVTVTEPPEDGDAQRGGGAPPAGQAGAGGAIAADEGPTYAELMDRINKATVAAALDMLDEDIGAFPNEKMRGELVEAATAARARLAVDKTPDAKVKA